jgi:SNF2 family DNA or RNA helicase
VEELQAWFEKHWDEAEEVTDDLVPVIERHTRLYSPFEVYAKSLQLYFQGHELTATEWERQQSRMYRVLDQYQKDGYHALLKIASDYNGGILSDGVGLGKTFIGMMLIERLLFDRKKVALFVPKAARGPVWEFALER